MFDEIKLFMQNNELLYDLNFEKVEVNASENSSRNIRFRKVLCSIVDFGTPVTCGSIGLYIHVDAGSAEEVKLLIGIDRVISGVEKNINTEVLSFKNSDLTTYFDYGHIDNWLQKNWSVVSDGDEQGLAIASMSLFGLAVALRGCVLHQNERVTHLH